MNEKREMLRHFLAALAYRTQKALRDMPEGFAEFEAGSKIRTPHQLVCHMTSVLGYARTFFIGGEYPRNARTDWDNDLATFHSMLEDMSRHLIEGTPLSGVTEEQLLQGPFADAMTHAGQIAMLRRLYGDPVQPENFIVAAISAENLSAQQPDPASPDEDWEEKIAK